MSSSALTYKEKENRLDSEISRWFVIYTKYKTEKYVVDKLKRKGVNAYVPLISYTKKYSRKIKHYEVPLINCYVFVKITKDEYVKVLETEYVTAFLKNRGNLNEVREEEIEILKKIVGENNNVASEEISFIEGKSVEIISGNLTGIRGKLIEQQGKSEFLVELESVGWQFRMLIDKSHLRSL
jgi:transcription antitermination factor NusG